VHSAWEPVDASISKEQELGVERFCLGNCTHALQWGRGGLNESGYAFFTAKAGGAGVTRVAKRIQRAMVGGALSVYY
jgi:hypothetical protein